MENKNAYNTSPVPAVRKGLLTKFEAKKIIEEEESFVAEHALQMLSAGFCSVKWAKSQVNRGVGDSSMVAAQMSIAGYVAISWSKYVIGKGVGNVAMAACRLADKLGVEWAGKQIERGFGDVAMAAAELAVERKASIGWAKGQIERNIGDVVKAVENMVNWGAATKTWGIEVLKNTQPIDGVIDMLADYVDRGEIDAMWAENLFRKN